MNSEVAVEMATNNETQTEGEKAGTVPCFFCQNIGVTFRDDNPVAENPALVEYLMRVKPEDITKAEGTTTFPVPAALFAHLMHLIYCDAPEDKVVNVAFDGIFPFDAPDENGVTRKFNAQLVTLSEADE